MKRRSLVIFLATLGIVLALVAVLPPVIAIFASMIAMELAVVWIGREGTDAPRRA